MGAAVVSETETILCSVCFPCVTRPSLAPRQCCVAGGHYITGPHLILTNAFSCREGRLKGSEVILLVLFPFLPPALVTRRCRASAHCRQA